MRAQRAFSPDWSIASTETYYVRAQRAFSPDWRIAATETYKTEK